MKTIEDIESYWSASPCNIRHSPWPVGTKQFFEDVERRKYFVEPHIPTFADFWGNRGKKILEIGSGLSTDTINFARVGCQVTAVDLSRRSLAIAVQRSQVYDVYDRITFYQANAEELSKTVPVEPYDLIYAFGSIHHSPNPRAIVEELMKYTRSGTQLKFMIYSKYSWKTLWMLLKFGYTKNFVAKYSEAVEGCPMTHVYSKREARKLFGGLKIIDIHVDHIFPYEIAAYRRWEYKKVWYFRYIPQPIFRWLEKRFGWQMLVTAEMP